MHFYTAGYVQCRYNITTSLYLPTISRLILLLPPCIACMYECIVYMYSYYYLTRSPLVLLLLIFPYYSEFFSHFSRKRGREACIMIFGRGLIILYSYYKHKIHSRRSSQRAHAQIIIILFYAMYHIFIIYPYYILSICV